MEHVFQFGINLDDEAIKNAVLEQATNSVIKSLYGDMRKSMFYMTYGDNIRGFSDQTEEIVKGFLKECKEEIIKRVVEELINSMKHSKNYREAVKEVMNA